MKVDWQDVEDLAREICGLKGDAPAEDGLIDKYGIDFDEFHKLIEALLPLTPVLTSPLTKTRYHCFIKEGTALVKTEAKEQR